MARELNAKERMQNPFPGRDTQGNFRIYTGIIISSFTCPGVLWKTD